MQLWVTIHSFGHFLFIGQCSNYSGSIQINWRLEISQCAEMFSFVNVWIFPVFLLCVGNKFLGKKKKEKFFRWICFIWADRMYNRPSFYYYDQNPLGVLLSCANWGFCYLNHCGITTFKYERKNKKDSGRSSILLAYCC